MAKSAKCALAYSTGPQTLVQLFLYSQVEIAWTQGPHFETRHKFRPVSVPDVQIHTRILTTMHLSWNASRVPCAEQATTLILAFCLPTNDYPRRLISTQSQPFRQDTDPRAAARRSPGNTHVHCSHWDMLLRSVKSS